MIYAPAEDSLLLAKAVKQYARHKRVLDICAGSGIQSKAAREAGATSVLAADISEESFAHLLKENIPAVRSNLFSAITGKFGLIVCNPPYLPLEKKEDAESRVATTGGKKGDEIILKFLRQAPKHLAKKGIILLVLSSLTYKKRIYKFLQKQSLQHEVVNSQRFFMETIKVWKVYRLSE